MWRMKSGRIADRLAFFLFLVSVGLLVFVYGAVVGRYQLFPYQALTLAKEEFDVLTNKDEAFFYRRVRNPQQTALRNSDKSWPGLNCVARIAADRKLSVMIMANDGEKLHEWNVDWFTMWPDARHVPKRLKPRSRPGTQIHGIVVMDNGDIVFNFDYLGLVRLDYRGKVVWRLPYLTHHSIHKHSDGNLWVCGQKEHTEPDERFPNRIPPFAEHTLLEVTPDGKIKHEWSVEELLRKNGYAGLVHLGSLDDLSTAVEGDTLHLNDVEPFPDTLQEGFFVKGDVLVSLRNINTVFVFNRESEKIKFVSVGRFVRQHDPDFIDGNSFSVFDNNNIATEAHHPQSRIVIVSAPDNNVRVFFEGNKQHPFFSDVMGKHQWLPNGDLLITESRNGRAFEIDRQGEIVWEYNNYVGRGVVGIVQEVFRLPTKYASVFSHLRSSLHNNVESDPMQENRQDHLDPAFESKEARK